jgi:uncharacterized lipoprotein YajG
MKLLNTLLALALFAACASPNRKLAQEENNQELNGREQRQFILSQAGGFNH